MINDECTEKYKYTPESPEREIEQGGLVSMTISAVLMALLEHGQCCNNNYQNRNLNASTASVGPSNRQRALNCGLSWRKMILSVRTAERV